MWPLLLLYYAGVAAVGFSLNYNYCGYRKIIKFREVKPLSKYHDTIVKQGGRVIRELPLVHAMAVKLPEHGQTLEWLATHPDVLFIEDDFPVKTLALPAARLRQGEQVVPWGVERIGASQLWEETAGGDCFNDEFAQ